MRPQILDKVLKTARFYEMFASGDKVLAAVSGGPDSVFLLHSIIQLKNKLGIKEISVCTADHCLRGAESERDVDFVKSLSKKLGLRCVSRKLDLSSGTLDGLSTEEKARVLRYRFFLEAAGETGARVIATGHTLDDQAETVIMRIIKGSSLKGVVGIPPVRKEKEAVFVRPLLELEKREISGYLREKDIGFCHDSTNDKPLFFRNIVRAEIIPFLERYNPRLKRSLFQFAEHLREDFEFIDQARAMTGEALIKTDRDAVSIPLRAMVIQPKALQKEILRDALIQSGGDVKKLSFRHWKEMEQFIKFKRTGNSLDLPGDIRITRTETSLILKKRDS